MARSDYQSLISALVRDQGNTLTSDDFERALDLAIARYSADAERVLVEDVVWTTPGFFGPLPLAWVPGSYLRAVEYPIGETPAHPVEASIYFEPGVGGIVPKLALPVALDAGQTVRVRFAVLHLLNGSMDTLPALHTEAVASYAAYLLFRQLAAHYSGERETSIQADGSNTDSRARAYATRAKECRSAYYAGIGKADPQADKGGAGPGSTTGQQPVASVSAWAGRGRLDLTVRGDVW